MTAKFPVRRTLALAAVALSAFLASCAAEAPPPAPPAPVPSVSLSERLIEQASAYRQYVDRAAQISPTFTDGGSVAQSLRTGEAYEPKQLLRGAIAYGAVVALQDPGFRSSVRAFAPDPAQRRMVAYQIMKDPNYVVGITGSAGAAGLVKSALSEDGKRLLAQGRAVKQAAYDVQHFAWSKKDVVGRDGRLALAKELSATPIAGDAQTSAKLQLAVTGAQPLMLTSSAVTPPYTPTVVRSLAVAALAALGYADDASAEQVMPLMADATAAQCLNMSKLNLYQCLAVAKPHYEDVFCLGQHVMMDTGACLMKSAGVAESPPITVASDLRLTPVSAKSGARPSRAKKR